MARASGSKVVFKRRDVRAGVVALVVLALLAVPLRAACHLVLPDTAHSAGVHQIWHDESQTKPCCASIGDTALLKSAVPDVSSGASMIFVATLLLSGLILPVSKRESLRKAKSRPPSLRYYARSARILR